MSYRVAEKFNELLFAVLKGERALKIEESNPSIAPHFSATVIAFLAAYAPS
jgi:hypothetical protein